MKTCVFIIGTNASGKTSAAREIMAKYGGVDEVRRTLTICNGRKTAFAGPYKEGSNYGGIDVLNETKSLEGIVRNAFGEGIDTVICEGSYLDTFGMNLTNAIFASDRQLVVFLHAPLEVIAKRIRERSGNEITRKVADKNKRIARAAKKWQEIGVPVLVIDTSRMTPAEIADSIINKIK